MTRRIGIAVVFPALLTALFVAPVRAEEPERAIDSARRDLVELRFEAALAKVETLLTLPDLGAEERLEAFVLRSEAHVAVGDLDAAEEDFRQILHLRPGFVPDAATTPSKAIARFEKQRKALVGMLRIDLVPADASVRVDGVDVAPNPDGSLPVLLGTRVIRVERQGFDPFTAEVEVVAGTPTPVLAHLVPNARTVVIRTVEPGVEVVVDGVSFGETDASASPRLVLTDLPLGEHVYELRKACYRTRRIEDFLSVDLYDRSPRELGPATLERGGSVLTLTGLPAAAEVKVDGSPDDRLAAGPATLCPGDRLVEVLVRGRVVWRERLPLADRSESVTEIVPRPNAVLVGAERWPVGLEGFAGAFSTLATIDAPADGFERRSFPEGTDLVVAVDPSGKRLLYSPHLDTVEALAAKVPETAAPAWVENAAGLLLADGDLGGPSRVVGVVPGGGADASGIRPGFRLLAIGDTTVASAREARGAISSLPAGSSFPVRCTDASGATRTLTVKGEPSPRLAIPEGPPGTSALRAAWASVDAAVSRARAPSALANLALLLAEAGRHGAAIETWKKVVWGGRTGIGDGTKDYYLGRSLEAMGDEPGAASAYRRAAASGATAMSDEGPALAAAAADRLADLGEASSTAR